MSTQPLTYLTVPEVAERLRCSDWSVYREIKAGNLLAAKVRGKWLVSDAAVDGYVAERLPRDDTARGPRRRRRRTA